MNDADTKRPIAPIAVFLSGGGRTLENLIKQVAVGDLAVDIRLVIGSAPAVRGVEIARAASIPTRVVRKTEFASAESYRDAMFGPCRDVGARWVVMAGFLKHVLIPDEFLGRVINIHPSLIPAFSGEGMYGIKVHEAAVARGVQFSGCTVHLVNNHYDQGPIVLQRICEVPAACTAQELADRVFELECEALPEAIRLLTGQGLDNHDRTSGGQSQDMSG